MKWKPPPNNLTLKSIETHIWRANLDKNNSNFAFLKTHLTKDEVEYAKRFKFKKHSNRFIIARGILRSLLGRYLEVTPRKIKIEYSDYGKPHFQNEKAINFNISHSKQMAVFAFSKYCNIGIDIEFINKKIEFDEIAKRFFSKNEVKTLNSLSDKDKVIGFYNCWTRKEAFIKAVGEGLSFPLDKFEVSLEPEKPAKIIKINCPQQDVSKWSIYAIKPEHNFVGSCVLEGSIERIKYWNW